MGDISIAILGGINAISAADMPEDRAEHIRVVLEKSALVGHRILSLGGRSVDAVTAAIAVLEDSPFFNTGVGAVLNRREMVELDALVMGGDRSLFGAVAGVHHIKNPIKLAHEILNTQNMAMFSGDAVDAFARSCGMICVEQDVLFTDDRYDQLMAVLEQDTELSIRWPLASGMVGAVARDQHGCLAAAGSSGGQVNHMSGLVSEAAVRGSGVFADDRVAAVIATGTGAHFAAESVVNRMLTMKESLSHACDAVLLSEFGERGEQGGLIGLDIDGHIHTANNCAGMMRAVIDPQGTISITLF